MRARLTKREEENEPCAKNERKIERTKRYHFNFAAFIRKIWMKDKRAEPNRRHLFSLGPIVKIHKDTHLHIGSLLFLLQLLLPGLKS